MPLIKRKPVTFYPLPSLSTVLQPIPAAPDAPSGSSPRASSPPKGKKPVAGLHPDETEDPAPTWNPPDGKDDEQQLDRLLAVFRGEMIAGHVTKGRKAGTLIATGELLIPVTTPDLPIGKESNGDPVKDSGEQVGETEKPAAVPVPSWRIWDRECWYMEETGEIFMDFESFCSRRTFYDQKLFQCEVSGKSAQTYFDAQGSEQKEARQTHTRTPRQLKKAILSAVQFHIEGKLETLADKIFERFMNRFFDEEKVFVDVEGDKYLARIVKTFPPKSLIQASSSLDIKPFSLPPGTFHPFATDLSLSLEEVNERDDPMAYFYNVRLIEEGAEEGVAIEDMSDRISAGNGANGEENPRWEGSTMEVKADQLSRDKINYSRAMLKRFIRDCTTRDAAVYAPWLIKKPVAARYGLPTEMTPEIRESIQRYKERMMDKRKREREERMGINNEPEPSVDEENDKPRTKKQRKEDEKRIKEEEKERLKEEAAAALAAEAPKKKPLKIPAEDLLIVWEEDRDTVQGRIQVRPTPNRQLPFGDQFEKFLMSWSFLNVMGTPLGLSPFSLDDYEQALYHNDPWTSPTPLIVEIHATLLNALVQDTFSGHEALQLNGHGSSPAGNDTDYWEGRKGASIETLRPVAGPLAAAWKSNPLKAKDNRKGWEASLVGLLWERGSLEMLPSYLDNILHLTFEDKPAPTRPTWSTAPAQATSSHGLVPTKPEKRYSTLHHLHKLDIVSFLTMLVAQTVSIRDFMDQSTNALTRVRNEQAEGKREYKRLEAERQALEPKASSDDEEKPNGEAPDGDVPAIIEPVNGRSTSSEPSLNGIVNGTATNTERDELEDSLEADADDDAMSDGTPAMEDDGPSIAAANRRKAMKERAAEREAEEAVKSAKAVRDLADARAKKNESKVLVEEKKRLTDELATLKAKLRSLEFDFRSHLFTLRTKPFGLDRFGNKVWWLDGLGSAPLYGDNGRVSLGTARLYLQGVEENEAEYIELRSVSGEDYGPPGAEEVEERRGLEEGEGRLGPGEWAVYENPDQLNEFYSWLTPRGIREFALLKALRQWLPEIEGGMRRRRLLAGMDISLDAEEMREPMRKSRPARRVAGGGDEEVVGYMGWRNRRAV